MNSIQFLFEKLFDGKKRNNAGKNLLENRIGNFSKNKLI